MLDLAQANLVRLRERFHAHPLTDPNLCALWQGTPEVLRVSPHRTVLRIESEGSAWLFKVYHPQRTANWLRNLLRRPPSLREAATAQSMGVQQILSEQLLPDLGVFARPWNPAPSAPRPHDPQSAGLYGASLKKLHQSGWSDRDLAFEDFLWDREELWPADLGEASFCAGRPAPKRHQHRDLLHLLSSCRFAERASWGVEFAEGHGSNSPLPLLQKATHLRGRRARKQSRRALRDCSTFARTAEGLVRRQDPPSESSFQEVRAPSPALAAQLHQQLHLCELLQVSAPKSWLLQGEKVWLLGGPEQGAVARIKQAFQNEGLGLQPDSALSSYLQHAWKADCHDTLPTIQSSNW